MGGDQDQCVTGLGCDGIGLTNPVEKTILENTQVKQKLRKARSRRGFRMRMEASMIMGSPMWPPVICNAKNIVCCCLNSGGSIDALNGGR